MLEKSSGAIPVGKYINSKTKREYKCPICHDIFLRTPQAVYNQKQINCYKCCRKQGGILNRLSINKIITILQDHNFIWAGTYNEYINNRTKLTLQCKCGNICKKSIQDITKHNVTTCSHCDDPIIGQKIHQFTIINVKSSRSFGCKVLCQCECGKRTKWYKASVVLSGNTKSCGHCNDPNIGDIFNQLAIINKQEKNIGCRVKCICKCGKETKWYNSFVVTSGWIKTCGHCNDPKVGDRFNSLTIIEVKSKNLGCSVRCKCDCGKNTTWILPHTLKNNKRISCGNCKLKRNGKLTSYTALKLHEIIENITKLKWEHNYYINNICCDIVNIELKIIIEYDGYYYHKIRAGDRSLKDKNKHNKLIKNGWKILNIKSAGYDLPTEKQLQKILFNDFNHNCKKKTITMNSWKKEQQRYINRA